MRKHLENMTPLGRIGDPDDIGLLATFLATKGGAFITGETIIADGGMSISQGA
jgi:NAD(P)-dependent dehydrogenase (short-subunit alcohol dehydrogenase family)